MTDENNTKVRIFYLQQTLQHKEENVEVKRREVGPLREHIYISKTNE